MPSGVVSVGVLADFAELIEQSDAAGISIEAFAGKVVTSSRTASRAMVDFMKTNGATADEMKAAAAETAAAWDKTYGQLSRGAKAQADASLSASRAAKESAEQQSAAYAQTAAAAREAETVQKAASDAAVAAAAKTAAAAEASAERVTAAGKKLASVGKWTLFGGAAAVAVSVDGAAKLQTAMEQLHTQAGVSQGAIKGLTTSVMNLAGPLATSPDALAASLYHVYSGGIKGAEAMKVMDTAAKEAKVSGADLTDTTTALTAAVYSGISGAQNYSKAMGILNATVGSGDMKFQDLNEALGGPMLATVKGYGLSLKDVGAALATFGDDNIRGADAATQLRMAVQYMAKPAATSGPVLQQLGLSTTSFADAMSKGGLLPALQLLHDKLVAAQIPAKDYGQVMSDIFSKKGASGITILENSLDKLKSKYVDIGKQSDQTNQDWDAWNKTLKADMDRLEATVEALGDKFGTALIPKLESVAHSAEDVVNWLDKNKTAAEILGGVITGVLSLAVSVYVYQSAAKFISATKGMITGIGQLGGKLISLAGPTAAADADIASVGTAAGVAEGEVATAGTGIVTAADTTATGVDAALGATGVGGVLVALGIGATVLAEHWHGEMQDIKNDAQSIVAPIESAFSSIISDITGTVSKGVNAVTSELSGGVTGGLIEGKGGGTGGTSGLSVAATAKRMMAADPGLTHAQAMKQARQQVASTMGAGSQSNSSGAATTHVSAASFETSANWAKTLLSAMGVKSSTGAVTALEDFQQREGPFGTQAQYNPLNVSGPLPGTGKFLGTPAENYGSPQAGIQGELAYFKQYGPGVIAALRTGNVSSVEAAVKALGPNAFGSDTDTPWAGSTASTTAPAGSNSGTSTSSATPPISSILSTIQNLGSGAKLPAAVQAAVATNQATQTQDQATAVQAVGQAQVTVLQAINQQLQDKGAAIVQKLSDRQAKADDQSAKIVTALKDSTQTASDKATAQVTALKDQQTINDENSAILVAKIQDQTTAINDASAITVAAINASATRIADADNATATLITDNAQTNADTINERGLYGLNLVAQQLQVVADQVKAGFDTQIATAQATLDSDQGLANIANAAQQYNVDQVTATQDMKVLQAQQNLNTVTLKQDALEAKAQAHLDAVTAKQDALEAAAKIHVDSVTMTQDAKANAAKAHLDSVTISQDNRILKATQHADAVQLSVDTTKIGPAQTIADWAATQSKTIQTEAQNNLTLATAQGNQTVNAAQLQLQNVTAGANDLIADAQNSYQKVQNAANTAIQTATNQYSTAQDKANQAIQTATSQYTAAQDKANTAIQNATDNYQTVQDKANRAIANATQTAAQTASNWATQLANDQLALTGIQGKAAIGEAGAQGAVSTEQALASTQFAGSGLQVNIYGYSAGDAAQIGTEASWAIRTAGIATA